MKYWDLILLIVAALLVLGVILFLAFAPAIAERQRNVVRAPSGAAQGADRSAGAGAGDGPAGMGAAAQVTPEARQLHDSLFVADMHSDMLLWKRDPLERAGRGHTDIPRLIEGNVALQVFAAVTKVPSGADYRGNARDSDAITLLSVGQLWPIRTWDSLLERALYQAGKLERAAARSEGRLTIIRSQQDLARYIERRAHRSRGRTAGLLAVEGLHALEGRIDAVDTLFAAGYRMMGLAHMHDNAAAGSAHGIERYGLTTFGRRVVSRMQELNIIVDLAHASAAAFDEAIALSSGPVVVSHTGVDGTCPGTRNLSDAQIRAVAKTGGIIGIGYWKGAVCDVSVDAIVRAIRYAADLVGPEYVGLGSDFDGTVTTPFDTSDLARLTQGLLDAGFTPSEIAMIMGGNVRRVLQDTLPDER